MNSKVKNYVDVLFKGIPNTKKAQELKEEILSNLNEHFEAHIAEGKSENQAYTESLAEMGDIDELLKEIEPDMALKEKIDAQRKIRARNTAISVMLYIVSVIFVIVLGTIGDYIGKEGLLGIIGIVLMFGCVAAATGLLIYTHMSTPSDVAQYIQKGSYKNNYSKGSSQKNRTLNAIMQLYWPLVLVIYLGISFLTSRWGITWLIWIIAAALKNALFAFLDVTDEEVEC